jgi:hypothetical protein
MKVKKTTIIGLLAVITVLTSVVIFIQASSKQNKFEDYLSANGWTYNEFKRRINRGDFSEEEGVNIESMMYRSFLLFDNITHMYDKSELVIHGVIDSSYIDADFDATGIEMPDVYTRFNVTIKEALKGNPTSDTMMVTQYGGVYNGATFKVKDVPLMEVGDEVVLFLTYNPTAKSYVIMGGPQGRYQIQNGKLYHLSELDESIELVTPWLHVKGVDATKLRQTLTP